MIDIYDTLKEEPEIWDYFLKKEEYSPKKLDHHERFTYVNSIYKNVLSPDVSKYLVEKGLEAEYPNNSKFAVCLTHDVDDIYPPLKHTLASSFYCLKDFNFNSLKKEISWKFGNKKNSPYLDFKHIMQLEEKYNAKSSFYFITAKEDPIRFRYDIEDIVIELDYIYENDWDIGLHGGYYSYIDLKEIVKEKERLEKTLGHKIIGFRNHYLRFKVPETWELLSKAGFKYDTTFGYTDRVGFRNGMCHPFRPYNLNENKSIDILEIPLVIMDGTLFEVANSFEDAWKYTKDLINTVEKYNGVITILWHTNVFNCAFRKNWKMLYEKILKYCFEKNAWMTSGREIYEWWTNEY